MRTAPNSHGLGTFEFNRRQYLNLNPKLNFGFNTRLEHNQVPEKRGEFHAVDPLRAFWIPRFRTRLCPLAPPLGIVSKVHRLVYHSASLLRAFGIPRLRTRFCPLAPPLGMGVKWRQSLGCRV